MSEPLFTTATLAAFLALMALVHFFKTLDADLWHAWRNPIGAGVVIGIALRLLHVSHPVAFGVLLTIAAVWARHTGRESEAVDGMLIGAAMGAVAALPFLSARAGATAILAGAAAGYGITFAAFHVTERGRQFVIDAVTAAVAVGVAFIPSLLAAYGVPDRVTLIVVAAALPAAVVIAVFHQWPDVRAELRHEASLGFMTDADVRPTAHPFLRLGAAGWADKHAHREFVRLANKIALRKRQQRNRTDETARLYQLEIIKLRMQIQEMSKIDRDVSDTMTRNK
jgi:hypothetical protein